jgi:prepilin signal peptidase PulO-like enzyme (type II secretory pathway)
LHTLEASPDPMPPATVEEPRAVPQVWRRPLVVGLASVLALLCLLRYGADAHGFISAFTAAVLVVLAATDLEVRLIPNRIVVPAAAIVLVAQLVFYPDRAAEWLISAVGAALFLFVPGVIKSGAIGMGDVKLALLMGAATGYAVLPALTIGFLALVPVALYMLAREGSAARKKHLPLGPFLAFGTLVVLLSGGVT